MNIPKKYKCIGCTMRCEQTDGKKDCIDNEYRDYDSAEGFASKEEAWEYYVSAIKGYYKRRKLRLEKDMRKKKKTT